MKKWFKIIISIMLIITYLKSCLYVREIVEAIPYKEEFVEEVPQEIIEEEIVVEYVPPVVPLVRTSLFFPLTLREQWLLQQLGMAEAQGEGVIGQALVMRVVLNRAIKWNKSVEEIIFATGQFYTDAIGYYVPNEDSYEALGMIMNGWDESQGAIYFNCGGYRIGKEPLFQYGGHYFTK